MSARVLPSLFCSPFVLWHVTPPSFPSHTFTTSLLSLFSRQCCTYLKLWLFHYFCSFSLLFIMAVLLLLTSPSCTLTTHCITIHHNRYLYCLLVSFTVSILSFVQYSVQPVSLPHHHSLKVYENVVQQVFFNFDKAYTKIHYFHTYGAISTNNRPPPFSLLPTPPV
jgi:hypothetical protein